MTWQLQDAKNKLSQLILAAGSEPQIISQRGKNTAVLLSYQNYQAIVKPRQTLQAVVRDYHGPEMPEIIRDNSVTGRASSIDLS